MSDIKKSADGQDHKPDHKDSGKQPDKVVQEQVQPSLLERIINAFKSDDKGDQPDMAKKEAHADDGSVKTQASENQVGEKQTGEGAAALEKKLDALSAEGEEKKLSLDDIEKMKAAAAGTGGESGFSLPPFLSAGHFSDVDSVPRDLGLPPLVNNIPEPILVVVSTAPNEAPPVPPNAHDDGFNPEKDPILVFESGLPGKGSDLDPNNPNPPAQPAAIMVGGNILANDNLGSPPASITKISFGGQDFLPGANGIVTASSPQGTLVVYTQDFGGHKAGDFTYTLLIDSQHPLGNGKNELGEVFTYTLTNAGGSDTADILIRIVDDVPIAVDDGVKTVEEGHKPLMGNVLANDVGGADGPAKVIAFLYDNGQHTAIVPDGGSITVSTALGGILTVSSDGSWEYFSPTSVDNSNDPVHDDFNYTITDSDADHSSANQGIIITDGPPPDPHDDGFGVAPDSYKVYESGLATGSDLDPNNPNAPAQPKPTEVSGNILANDTPGSDPSSITSIKFNNVVYAPVNGVVTINTGLGILTVYTQAGNGHNAGDFSYQLLTDADHPNAQGNNSISEIFNYTVTDIDGDSASANIKIQIVDDVPQAFNDPAKVVVEGQNGVSGNVLANDVQGADKPSLLSSFTYNGGTATVAPGSSTTVTTSIGGTLTVGSDGSWHYVSPASVDNSHGNVPDDFTYTIIDHDGDSSSAIQPIAVSDGPPPHTNDDGLGTLPEQFIVYESGLPSGSDHDPNNPNAPAQPKPTEVTGNVLLNDTFGSDPASISKIVYNGVTYTPVNGVITIPTADGALTLYTQPTNGHNAGDFVFDLTSKIDHPDAQGNNQIQQVFNYTLADSDGDSSSSNLVIRVVDDVPLAINDSFSIIKPPLPSYNLLFTIDVSGSMGEIVQAGKSRLDVVKEALTNNGALLDSYESSSSALHITIVTFSSGAQTSLSFTDVDAAKAYINGLSAGGTTNYTAAINAETAVINADNANAALTNYIDRAYFMSDGVPNPTSSALNAAQQTAWHNLLSADNVDSIVLNIAPPSNQGSVDQYLNPIANPGDTPMVYHVNADLSNLQGILIGTIGDVAHVSGNLLTNDVPGADTPIKLTEIHFTFDTAQKAAQYLAAHPELAGASANGNVVDIPIPNGSITTPLGQTLTVAADGSFTYAINSQAQDGTLDKMSYTIVDHDGDPSTAVFTFAISTAPDTHNDGFGTGPDAFITYESGLPSGSDNDPNNPSHPAAKATVVTGNVLANDTLGTGALITSLSFNGVNHTAVNGIITINTADGTIILYTQAIGGHNAGDFQYTLNQPADQAPGQGNNTFNEVFTYTLTNSTNLTSSANLLVQIVDDVPQAVNDPAKVVVEGQNGISGNVLANDVQGADKASPLTSFSYNGGTSTVPLGSSVTVTTALGGILTVASDGSWHYVSPASVNNSNGNVADNFSYTITDHDGDSSTAIQPIAVSDGPPPHTNDDGLGTAPDQFLVYESGLPSGSDHDPNNPNAPAQPKPTEVSGNILTNDTFGSDPASITKVVYNGITYTPVNGIISIPTADGSLKLYTQPINGHNAGDFVFDLTSKIDHAPGQGNNQLQQQFTYTLADSDGDSSSSNLVVKVVDDVPLAINDAFSIVKPPLPSYNLLFTIDISGSMGEIVQAGKSRLDVVKEALTNNGALLDSYESSSSALHITIVTFSSGAQTSLSFTDADAAKAYINGLSAGGSTNYTAAINAGTAVINADNANASLSGYIDRAYFMSDGVPNPTSSALNASQQAAWQNLLNADHIDSIVLNIAPPGNQGSVDQYLNPIANTGDSPLVYHVNADLSNLQGILIGTIGDVAHIDGNILTNDVSGADTSIHVTEIKFTFASAQSASQYLAAHPELTGASASGSSVSIPIPNGSITTPLGQTLVLGADGHFTYSINSKATDGLVENIGYTIVDHDGDPSSANFSFVISAAPGGHDDGFGTGSDSFSVYESGLPGGSDTDSHNPNPPAQAKQTVVGGNILANDDLGSGAVISKVAFNNVAHTAVNGLITIDTGVGTLVVYTIAMNGHLAGDFQYTLHDDATHASGQGNNNFNELFTYTLTNNSNLSDSADLLIKVVDDVPQAINDPAKTVVEGGSALSGNVMSNDVLGADKPVSVTSISYNGGTANISAGGSITVTTSLGGILKVFSNGDWQYIPPASVNNKNGNVSDNFSYTITDKDGDSSTASQPIAVSDGPPPGTHDDGLGTGSDSFKVYESGLPSGSDRDANNPNPPAQAHNTAVSGNVLANDTMGSDPASITKIVYNGTTYAPVSGVISITTSDGNLKLYTQSGGGHLAGDFTFTLTSKDAHPTGQGNNELSQQFQYTLADSDGNSSSSNLVIKVVDDVPIAVNDDFSIVKPALPSYNLVFTLDISGSMGEIVQGNKSRLDVVKEALTSNGALLDSYDAASTSLHITIVTFSSGSQTSLAFTNVAAAKAYINGLDEGGTTNYTAAINASTAAINADAGNPALSGFIDKFYFMSDGEPNPTSSALNASQRTAWQNVLNNNHVDSIVLNIAPPGNQSSVDQYLNPIANTGDSPLVYHVNADLSNLQGLLISTIGDVAHIDGNLLSNDVAGADVPVKVTDIQFTFSSAQAASAYLTAHSGLSGATASGNTVTIPVPNGTIDTPLGQSLVIAANGSFTYTIGADASNNSTESFKYTIMDNDGDKSTAVANIAIDDGAISLRSFMVSSFAIEAPQEPSATVANDSAIVYESGLSNGSDKSKPVSASGNILVNDTLPSGATITSVTFNGTEYMAVNGVITIQTLIGTLLLYSADVNSHVAGDFEYTLNHAGHHPDGLDNNVLGESFTYNIVYGGENTISAELNVQVVDDVPKAVDDATVDSANGAPASGNVLTNDVSGADAPPHVTSFSYDGGAHSATVADGSSTTVATAQGGLLTVWSDGSWKYIPPEVSKDDSSHAKHSGNADKHTGNTDHRTHGHDKQDGKDMVAAKDGDHHSGSANAHSGNVDHHKGGHDHNDGDPKVTSFHDDFTYTMTDSDGDKSSATQYILVTTEEGQNDSHHGGHHGSKDDGCVTEIFFHTDDAKQYISDHHLSDVNAMVGSDGKTVHILLPKDGSGIEFTTPSGASLNINNKGDYSYTAPFEKAKAGESFECLFKDDRNHYFQGKLDINPNNHPDSLADLLGSKHGDHDDHGTVTLKGDPHSGDYIVDASQINKPESIPMKDLDMNLGNVLNYLKIAHDGSGNDAASHDALADLGGKAHNDHSHHVDPANYTAPAHTEEHAIQQHIDQASAETGTHK